MSFPVAAILHICPCTIFDGIGLAVRSHRPVTGYDDLTIEAAARLDPGARQMISANCNVVAADTPAAPKRPIVNDVGNPGNSQPTELFIDKVAHVAHVGMP
jgi:hypothetical protein